MTIFINTLPVTEKSSGIRVFLLELLNAFAESNKSNINYCLITCGNNKKLFDNFSSNKQFSFMEVDVDNSSPLKRIYFEQFRLNKILNKSKNAILLNICNIAMLNCSMPQIIIIQKQTGIRSLRKTLPAKYRYISIMHIIYYDLLLEKSIKLSTKTIAISDYMVQFLEKYADKIEVIHEGVNFETFNNDEVLKASPLYDFPYIFSLSTLFPHKNMDKLIEAFALFKKAGNPNHKLVIAGKDPDGKQISILKKIATELQVQEDVIFTGWLPNEKIPVLYKFASLFVFLSGMEFFGLPVLEAMASRVPVISSNKMSLPEVVNNAGILVEPDNVLEISELMNELCNDQKLRAELIEKGLNNAHEFKWLTTAQKFEKVFESVNLN